MSREELRQWERKDRFLFRGIWATAVLAAVLLCGALVVSGCQGEAQETPEPAGYNGGSLLLLIPGGGG